MLKKSEKSGRNNDQKLSKTINTNFQEVQWTQAQVK